MGKPGARGPCSPRISARDADHTSMPCSNRRITWRCLPSTMTTALAVPAAERYRAASSASISPASVPGKDPGVLFGSASLLASSTRYVLPTVAMETAPRGCPAPRSP